MRRFFSALLCCTAAITDSYAATPKTDINFSVLQDIFGNALKDDPLLYQHVSSFPFDQYEIICVENSDYFYVDPLPDYLKNYLRGGYRYEQHVVSEMRKYVKKGTIAVDIGSHIGTHAIVLSKLVGETGTVYAFEPQVKIFTELGINLFMNSVNNVITKRQALGNETKLVETNPPLPTNEGGVGIGYGGDKVNMTTLDSYHLNNVSYIKIDVESMEEQVLLGARETILRNRPVISLEILGGASREDANVQRIVKERTLQLAEMGYIVKQLWHHDYLCLPQEMSN
jgi:FkbM family methyltransferase